MFKMLKAQAICLMMLGAVYGAAGELKVFQITTGYNYGPAVPRGNENIDNFGFAFHNGKMAAAWMENSEFVPPYPTCVDANCTSGQSPVLFKVASVQVNSPQDIIVGPNVVAAPAQPGFFQGQPYVTIDPNNTNRIAILGGNYLLNNGGTNISSVGMTITTSNDGGKTWNVNTSLRNNINSEDSKIPIPIGALEETDNRIQYDRFGNLYIAYLSGFAPSFSTLSTNQFPLFGYLAVSTDHGKSFKVIQKFDPRNTLQGSTGYDFPELAVGFDQVAVGMTNYSPTAVAGDFYIVPIKGLGKFGEPRLFQNPNGFFTGNGYGAISFSPQGGLLIPQLLLYLEDNFQSFDSIFTSFLPSGATTLPANRVYQPFRNIGVGGRAGYPPQQTRETGGRGTWGQPHVAYVYNSRHYGRVYIAYLDNPRVPGWPTAMTSGNYGPCSTPFTNPPTPPPVTCSQFPFYAYTNVYIAYSDDDGATWSEPYAIPKKIRYPKQNPAATRIMPSIAIDQTTGNIGVAWLDAVNDPKDVKVQVFATVIPWDFFD
jgi:hypothetical protein